MPQSRSSLYIVVPRAQSQERIRHRSFSAARARARDP